MIKAYLPLLLIAAMAFLGSCLNSVSKNPKSIAVTGDTLAYHYETIDMTDSGCRLKPDSQHCAEAEIKYPVFPANAGLSNALKKALLKTPGFSDDAKGYTSLKQLAESCIVAYKAAKDSGDNSPPYSLYLEAPVIFQDTSVAVIKITSDVFSGGAHDNTLVLFLNWDIEARHEIVLNDLFKANYNAALTAIGEKIFRHDEKLSDTASLAQNYFFEGGKFTLNTNFSISAKGLTFLYNEYEIKSYAAGPTELFIPYSKIKSLLRPNTVVYQYIK